MQDLHISCHFSAKQKIDEVFSPKGNQAQVTDQRGREADWALTKQDKLRWRRLRLTSGVDLSD
jgi:hypothetical protein